jgi:hypothetical protein
MSAWQRPQAADPTYSPAAACVEFRAAAFTFCRFGFVAANTDHGRGNPANTVPKMTAQAREGNKEAIDARQHVRGAITHPIDVSQSRQVDSFVTSLAPANPDVF